MPLHTQLQALIQYKDAECEIVSNPWNKNRVQIIFKKIIKAHFHSKYQWELYVISSDGGPKFSRITPICDLSFSFSFETKQMYKFN